MHVQGLPSSQAAVGWGTGWATCPSGTCLSAGQPLVVLTLLWEVTSGTTERAAEPCDQAGSRSRLSQGDGREGTFGMFPKSLEPKGLAGHSCAESTVTGGFNCDTSKAHSAVCSWATQEPFSPAFPESLLQRHGRSPGWQEGNGAPAVENGLSGLSLAVNPTRQIQFLLLCIAEGSSVLPASGVKQHVLNYCFCSTLGYQPPLSSQPRRAWEAIQVFRGIFLQEYELQKKV